MTIGITPSLVCTPCPSATRDAGAYELVEENLTRECELTATTRSREPLPENNTIHRPEEQV